MTHGMDAIGFMPCLLLPIFSLIALAGVAFWLCMLIDCATNDPSEGNDKIVCSLVIVLLNWIGPLIYFLARRP